MDENVCVCWTCQCACLCIYYSRKEEIVKDNRKPTVQIVFSKRDGDFFVVIIIVAFLLFGYDRAFIGV